MRSDVSERALIVGLAMTGASVARALRARGTEVIATDDHPELGARRRAEKAGIELIEAPDEAELERLVSGVDLVLPSPGVPAHHPVFRLSRTAGVRVWSEFELAARWSGIPLVAITGTNGKTTVTNLVTQMLAASGRRTTSAGNNEVPLVDAIDEDLDVIVVEASSFRLKFTETFRPRVATWLNLAEDHLDWHESMQDYADAKARIWAGQRDDDVAVVNADDPVVMWAARTAPARVMTFSVATDADYALAPNPSRLVGPGGVTVIPVAELARSFPHDIANALAAVASALNAGATIDACRSVLSSFTGFPHRVTLVRDSGGVRYYDDSKATTPASVLAAARAFDSVVLIAGGRNKGLDLSVLASAVPPVRAVVAIGEAQAEVAAAFAGLVPLTLAATMDEAVLTAARTASPGDVVLLSPGCASFDWYGSYAERGDDFARAVRALD